MSETQANVEDLKQWDFRQIGTFSWDIDSNKMSINLGTTELPQISAGIYAFVIGDEVCRFGVSENDLIARVLWRGTIVTAFHNGDQSKGLGQKEASRWLERLTAHPDGGTVWARASAYFKSFTGTKIDSSLAEERHLIKLYKPYMNTARN